MKSKNIFSVLIVLGITVLALWSINRAYVYLTSIDSIVEVKLDEDEAVKNSESEEDSKAYTEEELLTQRLSNPRAGDIYLIKEAIDSFSFFQIAFYHHFARCTKHEYSLKCVLF